MSESKHDADDQFHQMFRKMYPLQVARIERETRERCAQQYKELSGYSFQQAVFDALRKGEVR